MRAAGGDIVIIRRLALAALTLALTGPAPASLGACASLKPGRLCCRVCGGTQKPCGDRCINADEPCSTIGGCACRSKTSSRR